MAIVAIDTATASLSVAIGDESGNVLGQWTTVAPRMHATQLHPVIDTLLSALGFAVTDVRGVIAGVGPGSYTGVRLGVTAAKAFAYALQVPVVGVSSLLAAAHGLQVTERPIGVLFDARRDEAYAGLFGLTPQGFGPLFPEARLPYAQAVRQMAEIAFAKDGSGRLFLVGDGAEAGAMHVRTIAPAADVRVYDNRSQVPAEAIYRAGLQDLITLLKAPEEDAYEHRAHALVPRYLQLAEAEARWRDEQKG